jgi:transposase-like protein
LGVISATGPRPGGETFARPVHVSQRRYEAVRAYLHEGASLQQAAARFGYTPSALASLVRDFRAGRLVLLAEPGKPGRKSSPANDRARGRVIELRRQGLSVYEISARLALEGTIDVVLVGTERRRPFFSACGPRGCGVSVNA